MYKLKLQAGAGSPGMRYRNPIWPSVSVHSARQSESASVPDASTACSECSQLRLSWSRRPYVLPIHIRNCLANSIHCMGQNLKSVSAYVCVCVCVCVCNCACVCTSLWGRIPVHLENGRRWRLGSYGPPVENGIRPMANQMVTCMIDDVVSCDLERWRSWPRYIWDNLENGGR